MDLTFKWDEKKSEENEMLPEYDFINSIRGKHYKAYRKGHFVEINKTNSQEKILK